MNEVHIIQRSRRNEVNEFFFYIIHTKSKRDKKVKENAVARLQEPH